MAMLNNQRVYDKLNFPSSKTISSYITQILKLITSPKSKMQSMVMAIFQLQSSSKRNQPTWTLTWDVSIFSGGSLVLASQNKAPHCSSWLAKQLGPRSQANLNPSGSSFCRWFLMISAAIPWSPLKPYQGKGRVIGPGLRMTWCIAW